MTDTEIIEEFGGNIPKPNIDKMKSSVQWRICLMSIHYVLQHPGKIWGMVGSQCELKQCELCCLRDVCTLHKNHPQVCTAAKAQEWLPGFAGCRQSCGEQQRSRSCLVLITYGTRETCAQGKVGSTGWRLH